jgi:hypothetical protein
VKPPYGPAEMDPGIFSLGGAQKQSPGVRGLLEAIDRLEATGLEMDQPKLEERGLTDDSPTALRIIVTTGRATTPGGEDQDGADKQTLLVNTAKPVQPGKKDKEYYARLLSERVVYRVPAKQLETIETIWKEQGERLRSLRLIQARANEPDAIEIHNAQGTIRLRRRATNTWMVDSPATGVQQADYEEVHGLLAALNADHQVKEFPTAEDAKLGLKGSTTTVSVWVGATAPPLPAARPGPKKPTPEVEPFPTLRKGVEGKPAVKLVFGNRAGDLVYVQRQADGVTTNVAVPEAVLARVKRGPLAYLHRNLTPFTSEDVTRVVLTRNGETSELTRPKPGSTWELKGPAGKARADKEQVNFLLTALARLKVEEWVKAKPGPTDLEQYGLKKPTLQIEVTSRVAGGAGTETRTYSFGKEAKLENGKTGVYGHFTGNQLGSPTDLVFLVHPGAIKQMQDAELRDRTVFDFEPSKVLQLKMAGLYGVKKDDDLRVRLEVERPKGEPWKIAPGPRSAPDGFKLDADKVDPFLVKLSRLKLARFIPGGSKKEYRLGRDQCTLFIELTLAGDKEPLWLVVGKQQEGTLYYAQSSTLGKDVFLLDAAALDPLLTTPPWINYFKKRQEP